MKIIAMAWRITDMEEFFALMYSTELLLSLRVLKAYRGSWHADRWIATGKR